MPNIFVSYRRADFNGNPSIQLLFDQLVQHFGNDKVFIDKHSIPIGTYFEPYLNQMIHWADVILVVMGKNWEQRHENGELRIFDRMDHVRAEIKLALMRNAREAIPVVPVLFDIRDLPQNIPAELWPIRKLNGQIIHSSSLHSDIKELIDRLSQFKGSEQALRQPTLLRQEIRITEGLNIFPGEELIEALPPSATLHLFEKENNWYLEIDCLENQRSEDLARIVNMGLLKNKNIHAAVGLLIHLFEINWDQCYVYRKNKVTGLRDMIFGIPKKNQYLPAVQYGEVPVYSLLSKFMMHFDEFVNKNELPAADYLPGNMTEIPDRFEIFGHTHGRSDDKRIFGEYVCSITHDLGGVQAATKELVYFPTYPDTRLQYLDINKTPALQGVRYCGHIARGRNGYHIIY